MGFAKGDMPLRRFAIEETPERKPYLDSIPDAGI